MLSSSTARRRRRRSVLSGMRVSPLALQVFGLFAFGISPAFGGAGRNIEETASYRVAMFFVFFLVLSLLLEQFFHRLEHCLHHTGQVGLEEAVHKIKEELMLMGFISLMLIALEEKIIRLCVEPSVDPDGIYCCSVQAPNITDFFAREEECCGLGVDDGGIYSDSYYGGGRRNLASTECEITDEYVACMNSTVSDWSANGGYVPGSDSNLLDVCRAPGQTTGHLPSGAHAFECTDTWTDPETGLTHTYASFMDASALHNLHTLIFLTALFHIVYSAIIMLLSQCCVKKWAQWEEYGDDEDETLDKLVAPADWADRRFVQCLVNFFQQFYKNVDPLAYLVIRKYYIVRNQLPMSFDFNVQLREAHRKDFKSLVGVSWWMWIVVIIQTLLDGYIVSTDHFFKMINTYIALITCLTVGTKLMFVYRDLVVHTLEATKGMGKSKEFGSRTLTETQLAMLQESTVSDYSVYNHIEADFWCRSRMGEKSPRILLAMIRLVMFQNSLVLAQFIFYVWQIGLTACFFQGRTRGGEDYSVLIIQLAVLLLMMFMNGFVTVPLYSLCSITLHHDHDDPSHTEDYAAVKKVRAEDQRLLDESKEAEALTLLRILNRFDEMEYDDLSKLGTKIGEELAVREKAGVQVKVDEPKVEKELELRPQAPAMAVDTALKAFRGAQTSFAKSDGINFASLGKNAFIMQAKAQILEMKIQTMQQRLEVFKRAQAKADAEQQKAQRISVATVPPGVGKKGRRSSTSNSIHEWDSRSPSPANSATGDTNSDPPLMSSDGWMEDGEGGLKQPESKQQGEPSIGATARNNAKVHPHIEHAASQSHGEHEEEEHEETMSELVAHHPGTVVAPIILLLVIALILLLISSLDGWYPAFGYYVPHWAYDGYGAPEYWSDLTQDEVEMTTYNTKYGTTDYTQCASGTKQSPIDIHVGSGEGYGYVKSTAHNYSLGDIVYFPNSYYVQYQDHDVPVYKCSTGHYGCGALVWDSHQYNMYKMKFHAPAEHRLDGLQTNAELQLYFCDGECDKKDDNWAAIAILLVVQQPSANTSETLPASVDELANILYDPGFDQDSDDYTTMETLSYATNLSNIVSKASGFYHYPGSMTVPPCYENVEWFVMSDVAVIGYDTWYALTKHIGYPGNSRPPATYYTTPTYYEPDSSHVTGINDVTLSENLLKPSYTYTGGGPTTSSSGH